MERGALKGFVIDTDFGNSSDNGYVIADHIFGDSAAANAHLIAAAPELYEALTAAANALRFHADRVTEHGCSPELLARQEAIREQSNAAFAALAKARGEQ